MGTYNQQNTNPTDKIPLYTLGTAKDKNNKVLWMCSHVNFSLQRSTLWILSGISELPTSLILCFEAIINVSFAWNFLEKIKLNIKTKQKPKLQKG